MSKAGKNRIEIDQMIRASAKEVNVPDSLTPERIEQMLLERQELHAESEYVTEKAGAGKGTRGRKMQRLYAGYVAAAAVAVLVCGSMLLAGTGESLMPAKKQEQKEAAVEAEAIISEKADAEEAAQASGTVPETKEIQRLDAGDLYQVAEDYDQVYDMVSENDSDRYICFAEELVDASPVMGSDGAASGSTKSDSVVNMTAQAEKQLADSEEEKRHSTTNLQTEGVDESDIVKTDGEFLYIVKGAEVLIVDIRDGTPKLMSRVHPGSKSASDDILELYVDADRMVLIAQEYETALVEEPAREKQSNYYHTVSRQRTTMYTYSLEQPENVQLLGKVSVDGSYYTSRKIGSMVYLFTEENLGQRCHEYGVTEDSWIPLAGSERIAADGIYLPEQGSYSLIVASADLSAPEEIVDSVMIVNQGATVYVSTEAIYLYHTKWLDTAMTEIAKFTFEDGIINAKGAGSVKGWVQDTFAVNEKEGQLRILTCDSSRGGSNLYVLDEELALLGSLIGIAPGETVYAARFLGDMAYFVTYRNVDPLFAADLSDPENPVILGELKITGYSEYLHMWEDGKLLGIGFETDPDSGRREGVKLSMFDASDSKQLAVCDSLCITDADYSPAMDQYKTVLADCSRNLIGFVVTEYAKGPENTYLLYQWKDGGFENLLTVELKQDANQVRGLYAGNYFYIVENGKVLAFDMADGFARAGELAY